MLQASYRRTYRKRPTQQVKPVSNLPDFTAYRKWLAPPPKPTLCFPQVDYDTAYCNGFPHLASALGCIRVARRVIFFIRTAQHNPKASLCPLARTFPLLVHLRLRPRTQIHSIHNDASIRIHPLNSPGAQTPHRPSTDQSAKGKGDLLLPGSYSPSKRRCGARVLARVPFESMYICELVTGR
jgi:hypothetical protein